MASSSQELVGFVQSQFRAAADPKKAKEMAAYLKTEMPFHGVQKPQRAPVFREMKKRFAPKSRRQYEAGVRALWRLPHREEKYAALEYARQAQQFVTSESIPLYEKLIREGAWWDLVDLAAIHLVGRTLLYERKTVRPVIEEWIEDEDLWIRRTAILSQNGHKEKTDAAQLFDHCLRRAGETEFFIRKAIGWALREYSYAEPAAVCDFLLANRDCLSGLSFREGAKQLVRTGMLT
ncbi:MAG: DNA alkylation repair protein [Planctomycetota bacterium]|jgi:3-methyladenine DNA glycosylase AlkD